MDIEKIKEDLSICYLKAIAAINGIALEQIYHDEDSIDVIIKKVIESNIGTFNSRISIQLKSTSSLSQYNITNDEIIYKLKVKNYNDLCRASALPSILVLFILPEDKNEWIHWTEQELLLKGQMYWISLQNREYSNNLSSVTIKIPKSNCLDVISIEKLLKKVAEEGCL